MDTTIISALLGIIAGVISGFLSGWFSLLGLRRESLDGTRRELYIQQLSAYKNLWSVVFTNSRYDLGDGILQKQGDEVFLDVRQAKTFIKGIDDFFISENGIFISKELLRVIFTTRKYILVALSDEHEKKLIKLSKIKIKQIERGLSHIQYYIQYDVNLRTAKPAKQLLGDEGS